MLPRPTHWEFNAIISRLNMADRDPQALTEYSEDGVDLTLIRWMLSLTPAERLQVVQRHSNAIVAIRELNASQ
jgi:hypothetical protein